MLRYRIYTERKNLHVVTRLADAIADGYTVLEAEGRWKKQHEKSVVLEFVGNKTFGQRVVDLARRIKAVNLQEAVLVTSEIVQGGLI